MFAHALLARGLGPEFLISEDEALDLAKAYVGWRQHYGGVLDPKTEALINLILVAAVIEGPRMMRVTGRRKAQKAQAAREKAASAASGAPRVVPMSGGFP